LSLPVRVLPTLQLDHLRTGRAISLCYVDPQPREPHFAYTMVQDVILVKGNLDGPAHTRRDRENGSQHYYPQPRSLPIGSRILPGVACLLPGSTGALTVEGSDGSAP
jgi:hypothetical protein